MKRIVQTRLVERDSYALKCDAEIREIRRRRVILDCTPVGAEYAGMAADGGWLDGRDILYSAFVDDGAFVAHGLADVSGLRVGDRVHVEADAHRRMGLLKNGTAADLVLGVLISKPDPAPVTDLAISENGSTFEFEQPCELDVHGITGIVSRAIESALPIELGPYDRQHRRLCRIPGWPLLVGYGPRLAKTREVGTVRLVASPDAKAALRLDCHLGSGGL